MAISFQGFRSLIENNPDAISLIDAQGDILYGSASSAKIFGYQPDEIVGRNCLDLMHPEDRDHANGALQEVLAAPQGPFQLDARVLHKDGSYCWVESTFSNFLFEPEVHAIVMQQRNIDARRAAEAEKQLRAEELARSNVRLEEFARVAAHDLREPLLTISLYSDMMLNRKQTDVTYKQMSKIVSESAARMAILIDGMLSFASSGKHEAPRLVDLQHAFVQATQNLLSLINTSCATITAGRLPVVTSNELQLISLFQNLLSNAMKYRAERPCEISVQAERRGPDWIVKVQDNGLGIAAENQNLIFMPFVRLANRHVPGCGLGLAVCKKIVEELGGTIWIESMLGQGSAFCFTLPAGDSTAFPSALRDQIV
jgi:PAS domain S-box-containing protein